MNLESARRLLYEISQVHLDSLDDAALKDMSSELKRQAASGTPAETILVQAYALVREAAARTLGMRPYDVQILAGIALHYGSLVEMQTGEGKTLAATAPVYLNALYGKGVHVLTFNDYLARRDAEWMRPLYEFLGISVGFVQEGMTKEQRKRAYSADITYLTAKESGFDYLRSFLAENPYDLVQRPFSYAVIDEADSILIDEARIPLVIAGKTEKAYGVDPVRMAEAVAELKPEEDFNLDEYERNVFLTEKGVSTIEKIFGCKNLYDEKNLQLLVDVGNALHARALLKKDADYIIRNRKIELVDEFTGRVADSRHWPYGLHEAIEARKGIYADTKGQIIASITLQNFIRQYPKIAGMTGTAISSSEEFLEFYGLSVAVIPTNKECIRTDLADIIFTHSEAKINALVKEIEKVHNTGRPILIGTRSVQESELLTARLKAIRVVCTVLNAKNDEQEAGIIANAGKPGSVTVSTNMAGRGTDIKLGGEHEEERELVVALGGLYVIGTNKHESRRIDDQLRGRAGRQGDPGSTRFFISLEDDLMKQYRLKELIPVQLYPKNIQEPLDSKVIRRETARAQRIIEGQNFQIRRTLQKYNVLMEHQNGIDMEKEGLKAPSSTWTYLIDDNPEQLGIIPMQMAFDPLSVMLTTINLAWFGAGKFIFKKQKTLK